MTEENFARTGKIFASDEGMTPTEKPLLLAADPIVAQARETLRSRVAQVTQTRGFPPGLDVILVGEDPASQVYVRNKEQRSNEIGIRSTVHRLPASATPEEVKTLVDRLNHDSQVDGILIQRPLPHRTFTEEALSSWVSPLKDVDAFHPENTGRLWLGLDCFAPCTPSGVMKILEYYGISVAGKRACVVGRSSIVGKPMTALLLQANATVTVAHSQTKDLPSVTRQAEILIVAAGKAGLIGRDHVMPGAVVIDVGMHRGTDKKLCGDVRFDEIASIASAITPVPGGVGPMTILTLLENTVAAAERSAKGKQ